MDLIADSSPSRLREESHLIIERFQQARNIPSDFAPLTFLIDYTTKQYIYMDESCIQSIGQPANFYYKEGLEGYLKQFYPSDFAVMNNKVFPVNFRFLERVPSERYADYIFSHNYRIQNPKGECVMMLQRYSYIYGKTPGRPIGVIGAAFDITHFKNDLSIVHTIEETIRYGEGIVNKLIYKKVHPLYDSCPRQLMSKREMEVLGFIAEGFNSKQIADKLRLSINTINNHRKKMLQKTNCKSSAELLSYSIKHGLL